MFGLQTNKCTLNIYFNSSDYLWEMLLDMIRINDHHAGKVLPLIATVG